MTLKNTKDVIFVCYSYEISEKYFVLWYKIDSGFYTHASSGSWVWSAMKCLSEHVPYWNLYVTVAIAQSGEVESRLGVERLGKKMNSLDSLRRHTNVVDHDKKRQSDHIDMII
jgi:hypothetical protein